MVQIKYIAGVQRYNNIKPTITRQKRYEYKKTSGSTITTTYTRTKNKVRFNLV